MHPGVPARIEPALQVQRGIRQPCKPARPGIDEESARHPDVAPGGRLASAVACRGGQLELVLAYTVKLHGSLQGITVRDHRRRRAAHLTPVALCRRAVLDRSGKNRDGGFVQVNRVPQRIRGKLQRRGAADGECDV